MKRKTTRDDVLQLALQVAKQDTWESVRLYDLAHRLKISLPDLELLFREKDDIVEAWLMQADERMMQLGEDKEFQHKNEQQKIEALFLTWFGTFDHYTQVARQMLISRLDPLHFHYFLPTLNRISRTVELVRESSHSKSTYVQRAIEETALASIFLSTLVFWMMDDSINHVRTAEFLRNELQVTVTLSALIPSLLVRLTQPLH